MASDSAASSPSVAAVANPFGDNRGIQFSIKTGGKRYNCTLQDRSAYERVKATRQNSTDSNTSNSSSASSVKSK